MGQIDIGLGRRYKGIMKSRKLGMRDLAQGTGPRSLSHCLPRPLRFPCQQLVGMLYQFDLLIRLLSGNNLLAPLRVAYRAFPIVMPTSC